jgi:hypothetical protein
MMSKTISQGDKVSFRLLSIPSINVVVINTLLIKRTLNTRNFITASKQRLRQWDQALNSGIFLRKVE